MIILLSLSLAGLFFGLVLVLIGNRLQAFMDFLEGAMFGLLPAFVVLRLWPHTMPSLGLFGAIACTFIGIALARFLKHGDDHDHVTLRIVFPLLFIHALTDGTTLAIASQWRGAGWSAGLGIVAHRFPEGLFLAKRFSLRVGISGAAWRLGLLGLATIVGAIAGNSAVNFFSDTVTDSIFAIGIGMLVGIVLFDDDHHHGHEHRMPDEHLEHPADCDHQHSHVATGIGLLVGIVFAALVPAPAPLFGLAHQGAFSSMPMLLPATGIALAIAFALSRWVPADTSFTVFFSVIALPAPLALVGMGLAIFRWRVEQRPQTNALDLTMPIVGGLLLAAICSWLASNESVIRLCAPLPVSPSICLIALLAGLSLWLSPGVARLLPIVASLHAPLWGLALLLLVADRPTCAKHLPRFLLVLLVLLPTLWSLEHARLSPFFVIPLGLALVAYAITHPPKQTWARLFVG